ncbi:hypothetical protein FD754_025556, partial [Muntiacus muntjak]
MDNQNSNEACAAPFAPSTDGEPAAGPPHLDALEKWRDQPKSPDPAAANEEGNNAILGLSFPRKLGMSLEDVAFTSVHGNDKADMVDLQDSIKSFIYELNLHGFSKIHHLGSSAGKKRMTIYHYSKFQRDKTLFLRTDQPATGKTATPKRKKQGTSTVHGTLGHGARGSRSSHLLSKQGCPSGE